MIIFLFSSGNEKFTEVQSHVSGLSSINSSFSYPQRLQTKKIQNYSPLRSSEYQPVNNRCDKPYLSSKKQTNLSRLYMRDRTNMDNEQIIQEYCRYRNANYQTPTKVCSFIEIKRVKLIHK